VCSSDLAVKPAASRRQFLWGGAAAAAMGGVMTAGLIFATRGQAYATKRIPAASVGYA